MNKIKKLSRLFKYLFTVFLIASPIITAIFWIDPQLTFFRELTVFGVALNKLWGPYFAFFDRFVYPPSTRFFGFLIDMLPTGCWMLIYYFLVKLFASYEKAEIFTYQSAKYIRNIGYTMLFNNLIISALNQVLMSMNLTWHNPPGKRTMILEMNMDLSSFLPIIIILISWIMMEASKLREEQEYIV